MNEYILPYHITDKMLPYAALISEKIGRITEKNGMTAKPHLRHSNKIKSIHSSLHIEAYSLSLNKVKDVIDGHAVWARQGKFRRSKMLMKPIKKSLPSIRTVCIN